MKYLSSFLGQLTLCAGLLLLPTESTAQVYFDFLAGLHPQLLNDGGASAHLNVAVGHQPKTGLGYGVHLGAMSVVTVSTTSSYTTLGIQYRWLDPKQQRFFAKLELGSLLQANYTTDGPFLYEYEGQFNPYLRAYLGYRVGRFSLGLNYTMIRPFREYILAFDPTVADFLRTGAIRERDQQDLQITIGFMLDKFKPVRKK